MNPRESALPRPVAMRLAAAEYGRCAEMFRSLSPAQWAMPTDCPAWDVRQMAAHMLGMAEMAASIRENVRQQRWATKVAGAGGSYLDALTKLQVNGVGEPWTFGYLIDVILTRDPWMHRLDIAAATGTEPRLTAEHDGVIVADVVAEWADRHGKDFELTLTGPAGGTWRAGANGPGWTLDAVDFCRAIARRPASTTVDDLLNTEVPY